MPHIEAAKNFLPGEGWKQVPFTYFRTGEQSGNRALAKLVHSDGFLPDGTLARVVTDQFGPVPKSFYNVWLDAEQWD